MLEVDVWRSTSGGGEGRRTLHLHRTRRTSAARLVQVLAAQRLLRHTAAQTNSSPRDQSLCVSYMSIVQPLEFPSPPALVIQYLCSLDALSNSSHKARMMSDITYNKPMSLRGRKPTNFSFNSHVFPFPLLRMLRQKRAYSSTRATQALGVSRTVSCRGAPGAPSTSGRYEPLCGAALPFRQRLPTGVHSNRLVWVGGGVQQVVEYPQLSCRAKRGDRTNKSKVLAMFPLSMRRNAVQRRRVSRGVCLSPTTHVMRVRVACLFLGTGSAASPWLSISIMSAIYRVSVDRDDCVLYFSNCYSHQDYTIAVRGGGG